MITQQNCLINLLSQIFLNILSILNLPHTTSMLLTNTTFLMDNIQWYSKTEFIGMFHLYTNSSDSLVIFMEQKNKYRLYMAASCFYIVQQIYTNKNCIY